MKTLKSTRTSLTMTLRARTAEDLMTSNPMSIRADATLSEAAAFLTDRGFGAAPVIDNAGRPLGVISRTDLFLHQSRLAGQAFGARGVDEWCRNSSFPEGDARVEVTAETTLREVMTKGVFCVAPGTPAPQVVAKILALGIRRLFVVDGQGVLVGVISAFDVLRKLRVPGNAENSRPMRAALLHAS